ARAHARDAPRADARAHGDDAVTHLDLGREVERRAAALQLRDALVVGSVDERADPRVAAGRGQTADVIPGEIRRAALDDVSGGVVAVGPRSRSHDAIGMELVVLERADVRPTGVAEARFAAEHAMAEIVVDLEGLRRAARVAERRVRQSIPGVVLKA